MPVSEMTYTVSSGTLNPSIPYCLQCILVNKDYYYYYYYLHQGGYIFILLVCLLAGVHIK